MRSRSIGGLSLALVALAACGDSSSTTAPLAVPNTGPSLATGTVAPTLTVQAARDTFPRGGSFPVTIVYRDAKGAVATPTQPLSVETSMQFSGTPNPTSPPYSLKAGAAGTLTVTANIVGKLTVTARTGTVQTTRTFTIVAPPVVRIALTPKTQTLTVGASGPLAWAVTDSIGTRVDTEVALRVTSLTPTVAAVDATGRITAKGAGTAKVVVTVLERTRGPVADTVTVTVVAPVLGSLQLAAGRPSLAIGAVDTVRVQALDVAQRAMDAPKPTWTSSAPAIARVSDGGVVTAVAVGTATITATSGTVRATVAYTVTAAAPAIPATTALPITVRYIGTVPASIQAIMPRVIARWQAIVAAGGAATPVTIGANTCFSGSPALNETIPGLLLFVRVQALDGRSNVLAQAGPCIVRQGGRSLPLVATLTFDTDDVAWLSTTGESLYSTALHETGHALGIGTLWGYQQPSLATGLSTTNPLFTGAGAAAAFKTAGGARLNLTGVPIENTAGRGPGGHWRMNTFGTELMVGVLQSSAQVPISAVTVASLQDMGYQVRASAADAYTLPSNAAAVRLPDEFPDVSDRIELPRHAVDARGRIAPLPSGTTRERQ